MRYTTVVVWMLHVQSSDMRDTLSVVNVFSLQGGPTTSAFLWIGLDRHDGYVGETSRHVVVFGSSVGAGEGSPNLGFITVLVFIVVVPNMTFSAHVERYFPLTVPVLAIEFIKGSRRSSCVVRGPTESDGSFESGIQALSFSKFEFFHSVNLKTFFLTNVALSLR